jgi:hypothetical protein
VRGLLILYFCWFYIYLKGSADVLVIISLLIVLLVGSDIYGSLRTFDMEFISEIVKMIVCINLFPGK